MWIENAQSQSTQFNEMEKENFYNYSHRKSCYYSEDNRPIKHGSSFKAGGEMMNSQAAFYVRKFNELPNFAAGITSADVVEKIRSGFACKDWKNKFEAVDVLRVLNKYHNDDIHTIFEKFWTEIKLSLDSTVTAILKNILYFVYEVFDCRVNKSLDERIIENLLPIILEKRHDPGQAKKYVKTMCSEIIKLIVNSFLCNTTLVCLCNGAMQIKLGQKYSNLSKKSIRLLGKALNNLQDNVSQCSQETIGCMFITFGETLSWTDQKCKSISKASLRFFVDKMGITNYNRFVDLLSEENKIAAQERQLLLEEPFKDTGNKPTRFSTILQEKKRSGEVKGDIMPNEHIKIEVLTPNTMNTQFSQNMTQRNYFGGNVSGMMLR